MSSQTSVERLEVQVSDQLCLHVARCGVGPPLLLLHGFTGSGESWAPLRSALSGQFSTVTVDLPGHGRSGSPVEPAPYALRSFASGLCKVLDQLGIGRVAVVGYSLGGRAALRFVLEHADRVAALVLESASPGIPDPAERAERASSDAELANFIESEGVEAFVDRWESLPLWRTQAALPASVLDEQRRVRLSNSATGLANSLRGAGAGSEPPTLGEASRIAVPALILAGELDPKYVAHGHRLAASIAGSSLEVVEGTGHAIHLERPREFAMLVSTFLSKVPMARGRWS